MEKTKDILKIMANGITCDYQPVKGGVLMILDESKSEEVDIMVFLALRERGLISKQKTSYNWHPIFRPSFKNPIEIYKITDLGRNYN